MNKDEIIQKIDLIKSAISPLNESSEYAHIAQYVSIELEHVRKGIAMSSFTSGTDLTGMTFGSLTVIGTCGKKPYSSNGGYIYKWKCLCTCGNVVERDTYQLTRYKGKIAQMCPSCRTKYIRTTHGQSHSKLYGIWTRMKQVCYDEKSPGYAYCGAKGINVCDEWVLDYVNFMNWAINNGATDTSKLKRKDTTKDFSPENCYFTEGRQITINGETHNLNEWCRIYNVHYSTIQARLKRGIPHDMLFSDISNFQKAK